MGGVAGNGTPAVVLGAFSQLNFYAISETCFPQFLGPFGNPKWRKNLSKRYNESALFLGVFSNGLCPILGVIF